MDLWGAEVYADLLRLNQLDLELFRLAGMEMPSAGSFLTYPISRAGRVPVRAGRFTVPTIMRRSRTRMVCLELAG